MCIEVGLMDRYEVLQGLRLVLFEPGSRRRHAQNSAAGMHAVCLAYRKDAWKLLSRGSKDVGEDLVAGALVLHCSTWLVHSRI